MNFAVFARNKIKNFNKKQKKIELTPHIYEQFECLKTNEIKEKKLKDHRHKESRKLKAVNNFFYYTQGF